MAEATIGEALGLISKVSVNVDERLKTLESAIGKTLGASAGGGKLFQNKPEKEELVKKASPVIVTDFGRNAEKDLAGIGPGEAGEKPDGEKKEGFDFIKKLIGPAILILGGLGALVGGIFSKGGSGMQDVLQVIGKGGLTIGLKLAAKGLGTLLKPLLGKLPLIGSLISFGFAYSAFSNDDWVGGLFDLASGLAGLLYFVPGGQPFAMPLQMGIDALSAMLSVGTTQEEGETMGQAKARTLKEFMGKIFEKMKNYFPLKNFIQFGTGISEVIDGNFSSGISKMVTSMPIFDILSLINNLFLGGDSSVEDMQSGMGEKISNIAGGAKTFFAALIDPIKDKFPMKNFIGIYQGIGKVFGGNFKEGLMQIGRNGMPGLAAIADFFFGQSDEETGERTEPGYKAAFGKMKDFFGPIKDKLLMKLLNLFPEKFGIRNKVANLLGVDLGPVEDDMESIQEARDANTKEIYGEYAGMSAAEQVAAMKNAKNIDDGIITKNGEVVIPDAQDTLYAMKDEGPLGKALNKTPEMLGKLIDVEYDSLVLLKEQNLILKSILEKTGIVSPPSTNQPNQSKNFDQSGDAFRSLQMGY
tara:strand:- start:4483 stop:6234 length:1752 start_codon:yes stop_codon:yes gene_type:complete